jgi:hypothetical protein
MGVGTKIPRLKLKAQGKNQTPRSDRRPGLKFGSSFDL